LGSYIYVNRVPLRDSDDALLVNWCESRTTNAQSKLAFCDSWSTSHAVSIVVEGRIAYMAKGAPKYLQ
jgi:hypothetical protein